MARVDQYEIWAQGDDGRWTFIGAFLNLDVANALVYARRNRVRLVHKIYENGTVLSEDILAEIGRSADRVP